MGEGRAVYRVLMGNLRERDHLGKIQEPNISIQNFYLEPVTPSMLAAAVPLLTARGYRNRTL
jgi:hypothetical protein